jgi:pSer/pThr/pTyr-binding forkhead associated (FHA) protein
MIIFEENKFFLVDTGSSNGSFINNIRLSKSGEESKLTRIYSDDVLRFGSDVLDKVKLSRPKFSSVRLCYHEIHETKISQFYIGNIISFHLFVINSKPE